MGCGDDVLVNLVAMISIMRGGLNLCDSVTGYCQVTDSGFSHGDDGGMTGDPSYGCACHAENEV